MVLRSDAMGELTRRAADEQFLDLLETEAIAKTSLIMLFIKALGYDGTDPREVVPEFTADVGVKQGEKVDYAIIINGSPMIIFECKKVSDPLDVSRVSQLIRYFNNTDAEVGVLTNGVVYKFFSDLDKENIMDETPFLVIDLSKPGTRDFDVLDMFSKGAFDPEAIKSLAASMKYMRGIKDYLAKSYNQPDEDFVGLVARKMLPSGTNLTQQRREQFEELTKRAFGEFVSDQISNMLRRVQAINIEPDEPDSANLAETAETADIPQQTPVEGKNIETTVEEIEAYDLVKDIVADVTDAELITMRDQQSYCGVLFDNNNRRPICRLHFNNTSRKTIEIFGWGDDGRTSASHGIESVSDISAYANQLRAMVLHYAQE